MPRFGLLGVVAAGCCMLALPAVSGAGDSPSIDRLRADDADLAAKARSAVLDLYSVDLRLAAARRRLAALQSTTRRLEAERASIRRQRLLARVDERLLQDRVAARLRFLYLHGSTSPLEVLLGARSLDDAITQLDDVNRVAAADQGVLVQVQLTRVRLAGLSRALRARTEVLTEATRTSTVTAGELRRARAERADYLARLTQKRALDSAQIDELTRQARAAEVRSRQLAKPAPLPPQTTERSGSVASFAVSSVHGGRTITVTATGYDLSGTTSSGIPVGWGVAAVDPSVIPLGSRLTVPGYGVAIAADIGSSIHGSTIDLWFPTPAQAEAWGRRLVTVVLH